MTYSNYACEILMIAQHAGKKIMQHYDMTGPIDVTTKADQSPVTVADVEANTYIVDALQRLTPDIPVVSEENSEEENQQAKLAEYFWLVDPLDGTKSFIKRQGEFTVNIALIHHDTPIGGVVYVPAQGISYFTAEGGKAYKQEPGNDPFLIHVCDVQSEGHIVVASLSHRTEETDAFIATLPRVNTLVSAASSVKFCLIAEGSATIYPRFGPTMEWDTAAGHAVILAAGGKVIDINGHPLRYGKPDLLNPFFIACGNNFEV